MMDVILFFMRVWVWFEEAFGAPVNSDYLGEVATIQSIQRADVKQKRSGPGGMGPNQVLESTF